MAHEVEQVNRLTMSDLECDAKPVKSLEWKEGQPAPKMPLCRLYGIVAKVGEGEDKNTGNRIVYFIGDFEGINLQTGEIMASNKLYLPDGASAKLESTVRQAQSKNKGATVNFAFEIRAVRSTKTRAGYVYETAEIMQPEQVDALAGVRAVVDKAPRPKPVEVAKKAS